VSELLEVSADCLFLIIVITTICVIYQQRKSFVYTFIFGILAMSSAGIVGQILENQGVALNRYQFDALIALSFCVMAAIAHLRRNGNEIRNSFGNAFLILAVIFVFLGNLLSRLFALNQMPGVLTQFTFVSGAEDNGAWLDVTSHLISGKALAFEQAGGPLVAFLSICQSVSRVTVYALTGKINDLSSVLNPLVIAYSLLIIFSAIALTPYLGRIGQKIGRSSIYIGISTWLLIVGAILIAQSSGHLSFIFVAVVYLNVISELVGNTNIGTRDKRLNVVCLISVMPVWLPLNTVSLGLSVWLLVSLAKDLKTGNAKRMIDLAIVPVILGVLYLSVLSLNYSVSSSSQLKNLFSAQGGVGAVSPIFIAILSTSLIVLSFMCTANEFKRLMPIIAVVGYTFFVITVDIWLTGQMNYGSTKLLIGALIVTSPVTCLYMTEKLILRIDGLVGKSFASALVVVIFMFGLLDSSTQSVLKSLSPSKWPQNLKTLERSWRDAVLIKSENIGLEDLPIGCVTRDDSGDIWFDMETYGCSRQLSSISGVWGISNLLNELQLWPDKIRVKQLKDLPVALLDRKLLVLDVNNHEVVDQITVGELRDYFQIHQPLN
jgi:hypothetical protein